LGVWVFSSVLKNSSSAQKRYQRIKLTGSPKELKESPSEKISDLGATILKRLV